MAYECNAFENSFGAGSGLAANPVAKHVCPSATTLKAPKQAWNLKEATDRLNSSSKEPLSSSILACQTLGHQALCVKFPEERG